MEAAHRCTHAHAHARGAGTPLVAHVPVVPASGLGEGFLGSRPPQLGAAAFLAPTGEN